MLTFTLAVSCLTSSNLPWFMDLTFQVPMQYCSLQHQTLLPSPVTSTTRHCFRFSSVSSFFLELFLYWSPVAYWAPTNLGSSCPIFLLFILFMGFSRQEYWSGLPFPSPVDCVLSELSTMTSPSWVALHGMAHSFIESDKAVVHVIRLASVPRLWFSFCLPSDGFPGGSVVKNLPVNAGDMCSIPGLARPHVLWGSQTHGPQIASGPCWLQLEKIPSSNEDPA